MKSFSKEHKEQLRILNVEAFKKECVKNLESLELGTYGYPPVKEEIPALVENAYVHVKKNYELKTQKEIKMGIIAIYIGGNDFLNNKGYTGLMRNKELTNEQKMEFLDEFIDKQLDLLEKKMNHE
jgi:hypothetical protein